MEATLVLFLYNALDYHVNECFPKTKIAMAVPVE